MSRRIRIDYKTIMSHDDLKLGLEATDILPPSRLIGGKYRLGKLLGEGGMGAVYAAEHTGLGTTVAVKLLNESFACDSNALSRFRREARATAAIRHDNIVEVYDTGTDEQGIPFIVMEMLNGESLSGFLRRERKLSPEVATTIALQILSGLAAAHAKTIIHRDLKPGNILLAQQDSGEQVVKILDFGISKFCQDPSLPDVTATGAVIGTPRFMAPEQARGDKDIDARVDIYSVGVLMYRMLSARLPVSGNNQREIIEKILAGNAPHLKSIADNVPQALADVVMKALSVDRDARQSSAETFISELREAMPDLTHHHTIPIAIPTSNTSSITNPTHSPSAPSLMGVAYSDMETRPDSAKAIRNEKRQLLYKRLRYGLSLTAILVAVIVGGYFFGPKKDNTSTLKPQTRENLFLAGNDYPGNPIRLGVTRYLPKDRLGEEYANILKYLADRLKRKIKLEVLDGYVNLSEKLEKGELELGALAAYAYIRATPNKNELELLATHVTASGKSYDGFIVARANSKIERLEDLKSKVFCYVSHTSTSGYLYPRAELRRHGIDPDKSFKSVHFAGDHLRALRMVFDGACDGAAIFTGMLYEAKSHGMSPERFKILLQTPRIPYDAYCSHKRVDAKLRQQLKAALLALKARSALASKVLGKESHIQGFAEASDSDYDPVRKIEKFLDSNEHIQAIKEKN